MFWDSFSKFSANFLDSLSVQNLSIYWVGSFEFELLAFCVRHTFFIWYNCFLIHWSMWLYMLLQLMHGLLGLTMGSLWRYAHTVLSKSCLNVGWLRLCECFSLIISHGLSKQLGESWKFWWSWRWLWSQITSYILILIKSYELQFA